MFAHIGPLCRSGVGFPGGHIDKFVGRYPFLNILPLTSIERQTIALLAS